MKVKNIFSGQVFEAKWSYKNSASIYGQPVLILEPDGKPIDAIFFEILDDGEGKAEKPGLSDPRD